MKAKEIMCMDCGQIFILSGQERETLRKRGKKRPSHCPACRNERRAHYRQLQKQKEKHREGKKNDLSVGLADL